jgi:excinuclease ABC subunit C
MGSETGAAVEIRKPAAGKHFRIMRMALENAKMDAERRLKAQENVPGLEELQRVLDLPALPKRIEGFDIAHLAGKHTVASLVSFSDGVPDKKRYRRFHIRQLKGAVDDYEAIREAVARRYTRVVNEELQVPDLVLIDGGKGQVRAAKEILEALGLRNVPAAGLAKEFEEIHLPDEDEPLRLPRSSEALKVLQAVRDETHRFATAFNQKLREKDAEFGLLESVPGIGPKRSRKLMQTYGSLQAIRDTPAEQISSSCGLPIESSRTLLLKLALDSDKSS